MKIGVSSASLYPEFVEDTLRSIGEMGIKNTEIFLNTFSEIKSDFVSELRKIKESYGINITALHPFTSGFEPYLLSRGYARRYKDGIDLYTRFFWVAAELGAKIFVLHGDRPKGEKPYLPEYCEHFLRLSRIAAKEGVILTQENVNGYVAADPDFVRGMVKELGNNAMFTFDVKQTVRAKVGTWEMYDAMRGHIAHMHLSDHNEKSDCLLPGNGEFNFEKLFRIAVADGYEGAALIEVYSNAYTTHSQLAESYNMLLEKYKSVL